MSGAFIADIEHILGQMCTWIQRAIFGETSRMRLLLDTPSESDLKAWNGTKCASQSSPAATNQLYLLARLKINLFETFALATRKLLEFYQIAKVGLGI